MRRKLVIGLVICLGFALSISPGHGARGPGEQSTGPDDLSRLTGSSSNGKNGNDYIERALRKEAIGDFSGALADYSTAIQIAPRSGVAHYYRAITYSALGRFREAIADLDATIREESRVAEAYLHRGRAHAEIGHVNAALADYDSAIRYATNTADDNLTEAAAYYEKGNFSSASSLFARAIQKSPRDDAVLNAVAWFKATCPDRSFRDGSEAIQKSTKACELTKWKNGSLVDTLAAAYAEVGEFDQAIKYQIQALAFKSTVPVSGKEMRERLRLYQAHKAFRNEPKLRKVRS